MKRRYYKHKENEEIYYTGKDQRNQDNLINMRSGSEYFIPGYMLDEWDTKKENFEEITKEQALKQIPTPYGLHSS